MLELICPFCGKSNPPDAERCQECDASLLPSQESGPGKVELPGWIPVDAGEGNESVSEESNADEIPEWLKRIRERSREERMLLEVPESLAGERQQAEITQPVELARSEDLPAEVSESEETVPAQVFRAPVVVPPLPDWPDSGLSIHDLPEKSLKSTLSRAKEPVFTPIPESPPPPPADLSVAEAPPGDVTQGDTLQVKKTGEEDTLEVSLDIVTPLPEVELPGLRVPAQVTTGLPGLKPTIHSPRLEITDLQRQHAALLEKMLEPEGDLPPVRPSRTGWMQWLSRLLLGMALIVMVGTPILFSSRLAPLPVLVPPELAAFYRLVEDLPGDSPVLLAVDYEAGLSAEMQAASEGVLHHLMMRNARLVVVSTNPVGPILADAALRSVHSEHSGYDVDQNVVLLGYIAGGAAGLQEFASRPQALSATFDLLPAWEQPALSGVNRLQDFEMVVVITENFETARMWIEQVQPKLEQRRMVIAASAQAAPLVLSYVDSGQVSGLISGLQGGALYNQLLQRQGKSLALWDSYQAGIYAIIFFILVGGIYQIIRMFFFSSKP